MGITKEKALDTLDRMDFFQGQRAGRELWNEKSRYVQEMDLQIFREDVAELKAYIADVVPKSEVEKLELTLQGVMWSVDKWLDEADYDADPIKRAITMREKTLQIVENAKTKVAREIFEEIESCLFEYGINRIFSYDKFAELKKKYTEGEDERKYRKYS